MQEKNCELKLNNFKIVSFIPARSGSKGIRDKNLTKLKNKLIIHWAIETSLKSKIIQKTFFSSNSIKYIKLANKYSSIFTIQRSTKLSQDFTTDYDVIKDFIKFLYSINIFPDIIVHLRPTTPVRNPKLVDKAIRYFFKNKKYSSLRSVHKMSETAYKSVKISKKGNLVPILDKYENLDDINLSRQLYPETFQPNGYVDIYRVKNILKNRSLLGKNSFPFVTDFQAELDTAEDLKFLKYMISLNSKKK